MSKNLRRIPKPPREQVTCSREAKWKIVKLAAQWDTNFIGVVNRLLAIHENRQEAKR